MVRARSILTTGVVCLVAALGAAGCGSSGVGTQPPSFSQLRTIAQAYFRATDSLGRPPQNKDELIQLLKEENFQDPEKLFRSPNDGEDFVILWGVDVREYDVGTTKRSSLPVLAYEKNGKDGKRLVLQLRQYVHEVKDEDFPNLPFPKGRKPL